MVRIFLSFLLFIGLIGCGPDKSRVDQEKDQFEALVAAKKAELDLASGTYKGFITRPGTDVRTPATLVVYTFMVLISNPSRTEFSRVPAIGGVLTAEASKADSPPILLATYGYGNFVSATGEFSLGQTNDISGGIYGMLAGNTITAQITGKFGGVSTLTVTRGEE